MVSCEFIARQRLRRIWPPQPGALGHGPLIQIAPQFRILVAIEAIDGRKGIDALAQLCREKLDADPFSGCVFIFRTRRRTAIKLLAYDSCEAPRYVELTLARASLLSF